ncbi:hypothetical protein B0H13DRAFT_1929384 [Mycena leptocephala]|nr:hypothetical protein B0H13DRAFT_1929384 [Mycena leptocephala]
MSVPLVYQGRRMKEDDRKINEMKTSQMRVSLLLGGQDSSGRRSCRTKIRKGSTKRPEKVRVTLDADGLAAVKAKAHRTKMRTMQRRMLPRRLRSSAPISADSRMPSPRCIESSSQSGGGPNSAPPPVEDQIQN